jgi:hypothetical protein
MKKLVSESISEFRKGKSLNEGVFDRVKTGFRSILNKIGKFLIAISRDGKILPVISPLNIGIMVKHGYVNGNAISYMPNRADVQLEPQLNGLKSVYERKIKDRELGDSTDPRFVLESKMINESKVPLEHPDKNIPNVNRDELYMEIEMAMHNPEEKALMVWGAPGIGKTQIVKAVLRANTGGRLIDVQTSKMAPDDWNLPAIWKNEVGALEARDLPKSWLPVYKPTGDPEMDKKLDEIANQGEGGILFLDELSRASGSVQNTCLKLVDERTTGDAILGSKWTIIAASNRAGDDPDSVMNFSTALGNRFEQVNYIPEFKNWKEWGIDKIDPRILDFLEFNQEYFYTLEDDPEKSIFASPRSWEGASKAIAKLMNYAKVKNMRVTIPMLTKAIGKNVGMDIATELSTFLRLLESFKKEDIEKILKNPDKAPLPKKAGSGYDQSEANALLSLVISSTRGRELDPQEFSNFAKYLIRLDNPSLATRGIKMMFDIHKYMHEELGEVDGREKYKEGVDIFIEKYKDIF